MRKISDKTKEKQKRCQGEGLNYSPWIRANETTSTGTMYIARNYKSGRDVHLLSMAEQKVYFLLLWSDEVLDIKEQFALDLLETKTIAEELGVKKPRYTMSTDFYLTVKDPVYNHMAISVKANPSALENQRTKELLEIEKTYWQRRGVYYEVVFADHINTTLVKNIRLLTRIHNTDLIYDDISAIKYLLTTKQIETDLTKELDFTALRIEYKKEVDTLYELLRTNENATNWRVHGEIHLPDIS